MKALRFLRDRFILFEWDTWADYGPIGCVFRGLVILGLAIVGGAGFLQIAIVILNRGFGINIPLP